MANKLPNYNHLKIKVLSELGSGTYGNVYRVRYNDKEYAMKVFKGVCPVPPTEIDVPSRVRSPYISRIFYIIHDKKGKSHENVLLLYELCAGCIRSVMKDMSDDFFYDKVNIFYKIVQALNTLHANRIVHLDFKVDNILVVEKNGIKTPYVTDFGLSRYTGNVYEGIDFSGISDRIFGIGTPVYLPPEHFRGSNVYGGFTDVWSLGVLALRFFTGEKLVPDKIKDDDVDDYIAILDEPDHLKKILNDFFKKIPKTKNYTRHKNDIKNLIKGLLVSDYSLRPTTQDILEFPIFDNIGKEIAYTYTIDDNMSHFTSNSKYTPLIIDKIKDYYTRVSLDDKKKRKSPLSRLLAINFFEAVNLAYKTIIMTNVDLLENKVNQRCIALASISLTLGKSCVEPNIILQKSGIKGFSINDLETWIKYIINKTHGALRSETNLFHRSKNIKELKRHLKKTIYDPYEYSNIMSYSCSNKENLNGFILFSELL